MIFVLGSPRTGSTLIYQILINTYNLIYFTNITNNYFYKHPLIGSILSMPFMGDVEYKSYYGKTKGLFGPSEASNIMKQWFHPISTKKITNFFKNVSRITTKPMIIKNAWNCFRIETLLKILPDIKFVWIRRDIVSSAFSDLKARILRGGRYVWNSAKSPNYERIRKMKYFEQVVEQQYDYNRFIMNNLKRLCPNSFIEVWYEDICKNVDDCISDISNFLNTNPKNTKFPSLEVNRYNNNGDFNLIRRYVYENIDRFEGYMR